jgi:hypothetical protein
VQACLVLPQSNSHGRAQIADFDWEDIHGIPVLTGAIHELSAPSYVDNTAFLVYLVPWISSKE